MATSRDSRISKPGRRSQTCDTCKVRHQKCNGARPQCSNCELRSLNCSYSTVRSRVSDRIPSNELSNIASLSPLVTISQTLSRERVSPIAVTGLPLKEDWPSQMTSMLVYGTSCSTTS